MESASPDVISTNGRTSPTTTAEGGGASPKSTSTIQIEDKIHQFEHGEQEKLKKEEKDRKRAVFERKLSKFNTPSPVEPEKPRRPSHVGKIAQKFSQTPKSEEEERETRKRREEFERKRSGFLTGSPEDLQRKMSEPEESRNRLDKRKLMFEDRDAALAAADQELSRKRQQEEEAEQRRKEFEAKSSVFKKLSASHDR